MKTHLHPFFYKLQNNFVFFDLKMHVPRLLSLFRWILSDLGRSDHPHRLRKINDRLSFLKSNTGGKLDFNLLKELRESCKKASSLSNTRTIDRQNLYDPDLSVRRCWLKNTLVNQKELDQIAVYAIQPAKKLVVGNRPRRSSVWLYKNVLMLLFLKEHQDIFDGSISKN